VERHITQRLIYFSVYVAFSLFPSEYLLSAYLLDKYTAGKIDIPRKIGFARAKRIRLGLGALIDVDSGGGINDRSIISRDERIVYI